LGTAIAAVYLLARPAQDDRISRHIVVTEADITWLEGSWQRSRKRPATAEELRSLIDDFVREEILYREASRLRLDRNDPMIRQRLTTGLEFLVKDLDANLEPSLAETEAYFVENQQHYEIAEGCSFAHVFIGSEQRGERAAEDAKALLTQLRSGEVGAERAGEYGDRFPEGSTLPLSTHEQVAREFGVEFADALFELEEDRWEGPIRSGHGLHLVLVTGSTGGRVPELAEVEVRVQADLIELRRQQAMDAFYSEAFRDYRVEIEMPQR